MWEAVYSDIERGMVCEIVSARAELLARQRPAWAVYETPAEVALKCGAGAHLPVDLLDVDPYGDAWPAIGAFFASQRPLPALLGLAVNDGLRHSLRLSAGWTIETMQPALKQFGNIGLYEDYLAVARWNLERLAGPHGYSVTHWAGYYCGHLSEMTHYAAVLERA